MFHVYPVSVIYVSIIAECISDSAKTVAIKHIDSRHVVQGKEGLGVG